MDGDEVNPNKLGLPKQLYYVKIVGVLADDAVEPHYREKVGGKYTNKVHAIALRDNLRKYKRLDARVFETQKLEWTEVED